MPVLLAQGDWEGAAFPAAVYRRLLLELGYDVIAPDENAILAPSEAYRAIADGRFDVWPSGLFPVHDSFLEDQLPSGNRVGDNVVVLGNQSPAGVMEGVLVNREWAETNDIGYLDDIVARPELLQQFDTNADGTADIFGCQLGTTCHALVERLILSNEWPFTQITDGSSTVLFDAVTRVGRGEPTLLYAWTPSDRVAQLIPGSDMVWLAVRNPLPGMMPATLPVSQCPAQPCTTGFVAADVRVVANREFTDSQAPARVLLEAVQIGVVETSRANELIAQGQNSPVDIDNHASAWIAANRAAVQVWLDAAIAAQ